MAKSNLRFARCPLPNTHLSIFQWILASSITCALKITSSGLHHCSSLQQRFASPSRVRPIQLFCAARASFGMVFWWICSPLLFSTDTYATFINHLRCYSCRFLISVICSLERCLCLLLMLLLHYAAQDCCIKTWRRSIPLGNQWRTAQHNRAGVESS